jgi:hypothetical protein
MQSCLIGALYEHNSRMSTRYRGTCTVLILSPKLSVSNFRNDKINSDSGVEPSSQVFDMRECACGLRSTRKIRSGGKSRTAAILGLALIATENPHFETASKNSPTRHLILGIPCYDRLAVEFACYRTG